MKCTAQVGRGLRLEVRCLFYQNSIGKGAGGEGTDAFVLEGHAVERVLPSSFCYLCRSRRGVG